MDDLVNYGIGVLGLVFGATYWFIDYLLHKKNDEKHFLKSISAAVIVLGIYFVITRIFVNGFEEKSWDDTKRFIILITLLLAVKEANFVLKSTKKGAMKLTINGLKLFAAIYAVVIVIGMFSNHEQLLNIIEIINDVWGISITLYTAFLIYVLRRNSNNDGGH